MTVGQLIELIKDLPSETHLTAWWDGMRYELDSENPIDWWQDFSSGVSVADINLIYLTGNQDEVKA